MLHHLRLLRKKVGLHIPYSWVGTTPQEHSNWEVPTDGFPTSAEASRCVIGT